MIMFIFSTSSDDLTKCHFVFGKVDLKNNYYIILNPTIIQNKRR